jgi:hypothetical protein
MPEYRIIGADLKEYGPVSAEQIRQWITEERVDSETRVQSAGEAEWKRLADIPELAAALPTASPPACPYCGKPCRDGSDSCSECGTAREDSPAKGFGREDEALEVRGSPCPACGSVNVHLGKLVARGESASVVFVPEGKRFLTLSLMGGVGLSADSSLACMDCGLVWSHLPPAKLKEFVFKHCRTSGSKDAYRLLSKAARLESKGELAGALAQYQAVKQKFAKTKAAHDAEASIRNLKRKKG